MSEESKTPPAAKPTKPAQKNVTIDLPKELKAVYANVAMISHTPAEMVIDFAQVLPRTPRGQVQARVIMSPLHAKMLQMALAQNIINYEKQYGAIRMPRKGSPLADNFFRFSQEGPGGSGPDSDDDKKE